ncbi:hypothetical protein N7466_011602 [Penicillium verhagenii]|uniref:uncharacterized protein n=1 Tax=Penicillium verhagenii TaxID=1562060 RepID=UPI002544F5FE|nr:uncharacterized protein N7466_011602 [Penicillium verhagenii]KAJ5915669.1 hypothetical protein N7466_011602 [Penicillium verhagenii]
MSSALQKNAPVLPIEIWSEILVRLYWTDHSALKSASLTNRKLRDIAAPILFRTLQMELFPSNRKWRLKNVGIIPLKHVRVIVVTGIGWQRGIGDWAGDGLLKVIESATGLQEFQYMPGFALFKIHQLYPHVIVHINSMDVCLAQRRRPRHPIERSIPYLECLRSLTSEWFDFDSISKPPTNANASYQARLKDIICASHNLETLKLIKRGNGSWPPPRGMITLQEGDVLPKLKHLHLYHMYLDETQSLLWAKSLQWETLESLSLVNGEWVDLVPGIANRLKSLKSFEVSLSESYPKLRDWVQFDEKLDPPPLYWKRAAQLCLFLESMPLLEKFVGYYVPQSILDTLSKLHGETLKHLRFRSTPRGHLAPNERPWPPSIENLETLADRFPNLQSLGLDLDWIYQEWPYETMTNIRQLKHLKHLEINIPSVFSRFGTPKHDFGVFGVNKMDDNACKRLIRFFEMGLDSVALYSLHIKIGEWEDAKWSPKTHFPRNEPMIIGERDSSGGMHFHRIYPPNRESKMIDPYMIMVPYSRDLYQSLLEIHGYDRPGSMDSGNSTRVSSDSMWGTLL